MLGEVVYMLTHRDNIMNDNTVEELRAWVLANPFKAADKIRALDNILNQWVEVGTELTDIVGDVRNLKRYRAFHDGCRTEDADGDFVLYSELAEALGDEYDRNTQKQ